MSNARKRNRIASATLAVVLFALMSTASSNAQTRIRLATLLPQGSSQYHALEEMGQQWKATTGGATVLTIYAGGTMGGEEDVVRRMRAGQLQAATLSASGLSSIDPAVGAIEKIPLLYHSLDEMEFVCSKMRPDLEQRLEQKGFVVLSWTDAGWVYIFSRQPYSKPEEFRSKKSRVFVGASDIEEAEVVNSLGLQAVPLEWSDVLISLQTGLVDTVPVTPFYALAGQYDLAAKNLLEVKYVPLGGATVMTKRAWDMLTADQHEKVLRAAGDAGRKIRDQSRAENQQAIDAMKRRGLQVLPVSPELEEEWRRFAESVYPRMRGKMIPADVFDKTLSLVADYRAGQKTGQP